MSKLRKIGFYPLRAISPPETARNFFDGKGVSAPHKLSDFFKKMVSKNNDFRYKNMKNTLSPKMTSKGV